MIFGGNHKIIQRGLMMFRKKFRPVPFTNDLQTQVKWRIEFEEFLTKNDMWDSQNNPTGMQK